MTHLDVHLNEHLNGHLNVSVDAANNHYPNDNETPGHCWLGVYGTQPWWTDAYHHSCCPVVVATVIPILGHGEVYVEAVGIASAELDLMPFDAMPWRPLLPWQLLLVCGCAAGTCCGSRQLRVLLAGLPCLQACRQGSSH